MARLKLNKVTRRFGSMKAVSELNFDVSEGEFFCLVGPSGSGKTTTLRLLAGFEKPDEGEILLDGERVNEVPPQDRNVGLVYQSYALFPTMSVWKNVAYGLEVRNLKREEINRRLGEVLRLVKLTGLENRNPSELSGGEQQRVALARALVIRPRILLLDEPLSSLDAKLRVGIRREIRRIQRELATTTLYVTHDQEEALMLGDRIGVMRDGHLEQVGSPTDVYLRPQTRFVAEFLGETTVLEGWIESVTRDSTVVLLGDGIRLPLPHVSGANAHNRVWCSIRPEALFFDAEPSEARRAISLVGTLSEPEFMGRTFRAEISVTGLPRPLIIEVPSRQYGDLTPGRSVRFWVDLAAIYCRPLT